MLRRNSHFFSKYNNRPSSWKCLVCKEDVLGSKEFCQKCNVTKEGKKRDIVLHPSGDWFCPKCSFRVYKNKDVCDDCLLKKN